ncbi:MAG: rhodanese-related sulfurtransferase, partial [Bacteroidetes bacterium]|nr:rhodanese-related sulfurtransferase [Bacteroidota bacterium]
IIMYCTGGIRCEKASAYMLHNGFKNVFHLEGGIIEYTRKANEQGLPLKFKGKNFVFDERLGERITPEIIAQCHQCGSVCDDHTNCENDGCHLLFIQCKNCAETYDGCCSQACAEEKKLPKEVQKSRRAGRENDAMIFNKSKDHPIRKHRHEWNILRKEVE